jgi:hypothetical protein
MPWNGEKAEGVAQAILRVSTIGGEPSKTIIGTLGQHGAEVRRTEDSLRLLRRSSNPNWEATTSWPVET